MMRYYYVKTNLFGVPAGQVERFADHRSGPLVADGSIEPFDPQKHGKKPGAADALAFIQARSEHRAELKAQRA